MMGTSQSVYCEEMRLCGKCQGRYEWEFVRQDVLVKVGVKDEENEGWWTKDEVNQGKV